MHQWQFSWPLHRRNWDPTPPLHQSLENKQQGRHAFVLSSFAVIAGVHGAAAEAAPGTVPRLPRRQVTPSSSSSLAQLI